MLQRIKSNIPLVGVALCTLLAVASCQTINSKTAPPELRDAISKQTAVAVEINNRLEDLTPEQMKEYIENNTQAWRELDLYYGGVE